VIARGSEQPDRPVQDRTPANIVKRPLRLSPMHQIKNVCSCKAPISFHHADGRVTCVRCRGRLEEVEG
jgi:hypothetical protein